MPTPKSNPLPRSPGAPENHGLPALTPDVVEQEKGQELDNIIPTQGFAKLPVVGLGGSAGGLAALQAFFGAMAPDGGMAFVVIVHLPPDHESILAEVLQRATAMPVCQVRDRIKVEANHVYVIPPAKHLSMRDGHLCLSEPARARPGKHVAVDLFFRTLADTHGPHSAAIVLSGADGDGAVGIKRIKERGGLTVAQDPTEAEHDSMPRTTIATGVVDWVLPAAEIPAKLCKYWRTEQRLQLPAEDGPQPAREMVPAAGAGPSANETAVRDILGFLRARTGRDFTYYKRATILRRIARRMQVNGMEDPAVYLAFLRTHPDETAALLQDLLISVTNFFRDREAFDALAAIIPALFQGKGPNDAVRVWSVACATGEEAYSIAMLLHEYAGTLDHPPTVQVFATDLDENAIQAARDGTYTETISADVSEERLRRFFTRGHGGYRIKREVRETVLFALHDLLKDSPFSRLDLVTCRNLLIYLNREAQERALDIIHFALRPEGKLFLGSSESVDDATALFAVTDKKHRLFARRALSRPRLPTVFTGSSAQTQALLRRPQEEPVPEPTPAAGGDRTSWSEVHARAIERFGPPSMIINREHDLVHLSGEAGRLLRLSHGEPSTNLLRLVHPLLRVELRAALFRAAQSGEVVETRGVPVEVEGKPRLVDIRVAPTLPGTPGFLLVIFTEREPTTAAQASRAVAGEDGEPAIRALERELEQSKSTLRDTVEQSEANQEELKASNEELQAMNEELRSTSEELETGREELQSINEELSTVNAEMKSKVAELRRSNGDLQNLMAATAIATVFLDRNLCIQRYTPSAVTLFNLIPTDVGRPLANLKPSLNHPDLSADAATVLERHAVLEREVSHPDGRIFLAQTRPYRTENDHIAGVVLTFVDISERERAESALAQSMRQLEQQTRIFDTTLSAIADFTYIFDRAGRFLYANRALADLLGLKPEALAGKNFHDLPYPPDLAEKLQRQIRWVFETGEPLTDEMPYTSPTGQSGIFEHIFRPVRAADGASVEFVAGSTRDITAHKRLEAQVHSQLIELENTYLTAPIGLALVDQDLRYVRVNERLAEMNGVPARTHVGRTIREIAGDITEPVEQSFRRIFATGEPLLNVEIEGEVAARSGVQRVWKANWYPLKNPSGETIAISVAVEEITERRRAERHAAFLAEITDHLARLRTPDEIMETVGAKIGTYLRLSLCAFMDIDEAADEAVLTHNWHRPDVPSLLGKYRIGEFVTGEFQRACRAGETFVVHDTAADPRTDADNYAAIHVGAFVSLPIVRDGAWRFLLVMFDSAAHPWRDDEVELMRELAARIWPRIERARADAELQAGRTQLQILVETAPLGIYLVDADFRLREVNPTALTVFGGVADLVGRDFDEVIHLLWSKRHADEIVALFRRTLATGEPYLAPEWIEQRLDRGRIEYYDWQINRVPLVDGRNGVVCYFRDISATVFARQTLAESEERLRLAAQAAGIFAYDIDRTTGEITYSEGAAQVLGYDALPGSLRRVADARERVHPDDRETVRRETERGLRERGTTTMEYRARSGSGGYVWVQSSGHAVYDAQGSPVRSVGIVQNIAARKAAEQARRQAEASLSMVVQSIEDYAIYMLDPGGRITTWNKGADRIKGFTAKEAIGQHFSICFTPESIAAGEPQRELAIAASQGRFHEEQWRMRKGGELYWGDELIVALRGEDGELIAHLNLCRDLSERKRHEDERARVLSVEQTARAQAEEANVAKDRFLAVLSHELRAPLAPVQMALYILQREKRVTARGREALKMIARNVGSETRLIDDLLDVSRIVHDKFDLTRAALNLHTCIGHAVEICGADLAAKDLRLTRSLEATRIHFEGDVERLQQVFVNLLKNAIKFTPRGGEITLRSSHCPPREGPGAADRVEDGPEAVCVEVSDTGIGIPEEMLPKLFDAFEQGGPDVVRVYGGLGLGLAISNAIVQAHGGKLMAASAGRDQGATFTVQLPTGAPPPVKTEKADPGTFAD